MTFLFSSFLNLRQPILQAYVGKLRVNDIAHSEDYTMVDCSAVLPSDPFEISDAAQIEALNIVDNDQKQSIMISDEDVRGEMIQHIQLPQQTEVTGAINSNCTTLSHLKQAVPDIVSTEEEINSNNLKSRLRSSENSPIVAMKTPKMLINMPFQANLTSLSKNKSIKQSRSKKKLQSNQTLSDRNHHSGIIVNTSIECQQNEVKRGESNEAQSDPVSMSQSTLTVEDDASSIDFKFITSNVYSKASQLKLTSPDIVSCGCKSSTNCTTSCFNRAMKIECIAPLCPNGENCKNQPIQQNSNMPTEVFQTNRKGRGVRSIGIIEKGIFIIEYVGEVITIAEYKERTKTLYKDDKHSYCIRLEKGFVIDARKMGNVSRFINHACSPNCEIEKWEVNGTPRLGLYAKRRIEAGEELTCNYQFEEYGLSSQPCYCESNGCTKYIGKPITAVIDSKNENKTHKCYPIFAEWEKLHSDNNQSIEIAVGTSANLAGLKIPKLRGHRFHSYHDFEEVSYFQILKY